MPDRPLAPAEASPRGEDARRRPLPSSRWPAARWVPSARAVGGLGAVLLLAVLVALLLVWQARPSAQAAPRVHRSLPPTTSTGGAASVLPASASGAGAPPPASPAPEVVVHVVGAVHRPGLVRLPSGSRVADAVTAAGGMTRHARAASVNLARRLVDGEQVVVQRRGRRLILAAPGAPDASTAGAPTTGGVAGARAASAPVDLNTATTEALDALPGIGPVLAQRIVDWRTAHGRFSAVDELGEVSGIGEATLGDLRPLVTV